ncbi:ZC3H10 [Cordylochernes scorpioides]|uniref:ZC3H10 n=1 Tax=Cordylochernes scorpioides TaxID=51811 RepID=A0ABY6L9I5_9ARAC|nr:ZC3H10 [Cordylochernes scorpioides]
MPDRTARISQHALHETSVLPLPSISPDLSSIENVWDLIGRRLHALHQPRLEDELWLMVDRAAIPQNIIDAFIESVPRHVAACKAVRGGPTAYGVYDDITLCIGELKRGAREAMTSDEATHSPDHKMKETVCRDFIRNVCHRGEKCKYLHPQDPTTFIKDLDFCHDFQNRECSRPNCKFLHFTRQEQQSYQSSGVIPQHLLETIRSSGGETNSTHKNGDAPICKDFLKGDCHRSGRCKFRHLSATEYEKEFGIAIKPQLPIEVYSNHYESYTGGYEPEPKRRLLDDIYRREPVMAFGPQDYRMAEVETAMLRRKIEELKKQVSDLQATNEFLLDQNAQLRLSKQTTTVSPLTAQTLIPHTLTPTVAISDLTAAAAQTTALASELGTPLCPVSIAPVSLATALPAVSLSQSLAQTIITMSGPTTSLVSYPIMTQSLRPVIPHSLGN